MKTHSEYSTQNPLPYRPSVSLLLQIESYINQQEWFPEIEKKYARRGHSEDLRKDKCRARYKAQFANGPVTVKHLMRAFHIQKQSVMLKMREYSYAGLVIFDPITDKYDWIKNGKP